MILDEIAAKTRERVERSKADVPLEAMKAAAGKKKKDTGFPFEEALKKPGMSFICEVKKASPSKGVIAPNFDYISIASEYKEAGADAMSVLTEPDYFMGNIFYMLEISRRVKNIPLLRKDFVIDEYMIYEAKVMGAQAVLLICALLEETTLSNYIQICDDLGLSALVEAHDEEEIKMALRCGARIIGVNNRDLKDFTVDIKNGIRLRKFVPESVLFVAESGIKTREDIIELEKNNVNAVLIGETLMRSKVKKIMLDELKGI